MRVVLTGVTNDVARQNYISTIVNPRLIADMVDLSPSQRADLEVLYPSGEFKFWGARPTARNRANFELMEIGATVLIYRSGSIVSAGEVTYKFENQPLAESTWLRLRDSTEDFSLIFALRDVRQLGISIDDYNAALDNSPDYFVRGFGLASEAKSELIYEFLDIQPVPLPDDEAQQPSPALPPGISDELDRTYKRAVRREQTHLRAALLGAKNATHAVCALCGKNLPVGLLWASHIKPRSRCSDDEKRDIPNVAMLACTLGCDALFERGYVGVDSKGAISVSTAISGAMEVAGHLLDRQCSAFTTARANYFAWHWTNRFAQAPPIPN